MKKKHNYLTWGRSRAGDVRVLQIALIRWTRYLVFAIPLLLSSCEEDPEDSGLISLDPETEEVTAFEIPMNGMQVSKVRYEIQNGDEFISSETDQAVSTLNLNDQDLIGKTCPVRIEIWTQEGCRQKVYVYQQLISFDGSLITLSPPGQWEAFYFFKASSKYKLFFPADPLHAFRFELHTEYPDGYGYIDRGLWDKHGEPVCGDMTMKELFVTSRITSVNLDDVHCEDPALFQVDCFVFLGHYPDKLLEFNLTWDIENGVLSHSCACK